MSLLTAAQIASALEAGTYTEPLNSINPFVVLDVTRREYPSIDVENITGEEKTKDVPTTNTKQTYLIHLYYRVTGFGDADEPNVKQFENEIFNVIDALQDTQTKISITESWSREHPVIPTPHIHSTLRVVTDEIASDVGGVVGDNITIRFPDPLGVLDVINLITDKLSPEKDLDIDSEGIQIFSNKYLTGILDVNVVITPAQELELDDLLSAGDDLTITLTKGGVQFVKNANLITRVNSSNRKTVQTTLISMDIKP